LSEDADQYILVLRHVYKSYKCPKLTKVQYWLNLSLKPFI